MARTLLTINGIGVRNLANLAFLTAWKKFLDRNSKHLDCDVLFVNNCFDQATIVPYLTPYPVFHLKDYVSRDLTVPFDTESSYWPIKVMCDKYDYVLRVDHDAFPTLQALQSIIKKTRELDADFVSASNFPRPIEHDRTNLKELDNRFAPAEKRSSWPWFPWGYPTHNSDLYAIRTDFFRAVEARYLQDPRIKQSPIFCRQCPFHTTILSYGQVCQIMGVREERYGNTQDVKIHIDGSINSDWWTYMCSLQPKYVGVAGADGGSFTTQNHIICSALAMQSPDFNSVRDKHNTAYPHKDNIVAPYFHLGNGYLSEWYLTPCARELENSYKHAIAHFVSPPFGSYAAHYAVTSMLAERCSEHSVQQMKQIMLKQVLEPVCKDIPAFNTYVQKVQEFYSQPLADYL